MYLGLARQYQATYSSTVRCDGKSYKSTKLGRKDSSKQECLPPKDLHHRGNSCQQKFLSKVTITLPLPPSSTINQSNCHSILFPYGLFLKSQSCIVIHTYPCLLRLILLPHSRGKGQGLQNNAFLSSSLYLHT